MLEIRAIEFLIKIIFKKEIKAENILNVRVIISSENPLITHLITIDKLFYSKTE